MIFILPLCVAFVMTAAFLYTDESPRWKAAAAIVLALSLLLQFVVQAPFIVPLLLQIVLGIALLFYYRFR